MAAELTAEERDELRRRHVPMDIPGLEDELWCRQCGGAWPCPTLRAVQMLERAERLLAWEVISWGGEEGRTDQVKHADIARALGYDWPDIDGWRAVAKKIQGEMAQVVAHVRQAMQP